MNRELMSYKGIKLILALISVMTIIQSVCIIYQAKWLADIISSLFAGHRLSSVSNQIIYFAFAFTGRYALSLLIKRGAYLFAQKTGTRLREQVLAKLFQLGPAFVRREGTGNLVTLVLEGISQVRTFIGLILPRMSSMGITPVMILMIVFIENKTSGVILLVTMPVLIVFMILLGLAAQKKMDMQWSAYRTLSNHFVDSLRGIETLKFLGLSKKHGTSIKRVSDKYRTMTMRTLRLAFLSSFALDFFTMLSVATVAVMLGLQLIKGEILLNSALMILILAPEYFLPVRELGADYHATLNGKEAASAIQSIMDVPNEQKIEDHLDLSPWNENSEMTLNKVSMYRNEEGKMSLNCINLNVKGFKKIGIIGESGAGKSTLIDILSGFITPTEGEIHLSGNEHPLSSLTHEEWRQQITYIPQTPYIFSQSVLDNVRFYKPSASDAEVKQALEQAGLADLVSQFPDGINEQIGNGGRMMSGGQEQRIALARAFLCERPIILLDEPTAHLDIETEYALKETMLPLFKQKLVFFATHRLHWMKQMDYIIVLNQGKIIEEGTLDELLNKKGEFHKLIQSQLEGLE
ncbi:thiol reductant ABC exporter subunit CydD [Terrilactibacillus laevilacticus]|uniref:Thiol reductant ABC exporter subunit CydD n=1 Tax=Terrilactibacillus laevilacticus TaxID=1380157 RepID=A0ABW5PQC1_9BACI|nr:thiol reductant ABC exporter subunit CydD [Terrilactibacillus laevilacticus]